MASPVVSRLGVAEQVGHGAARQGVKWCDGGGQGKAGMDRSEADRSSE